MSAKWQSAVSTLCSFLGLEEKEVLDDAGREIDRLKNMTMSGGCVVVGDIHSQSLYRLFREVHEKAKRYTDLEKLKPIDLLLDIWRIIVDFYAVSLTKLSSIMPLLNEICTNWWDYVSVGSDNSVLSMPELF